MLQALAKSWIVCTAMRVPSSLKVYIYILLSIYRIDGSRSGKRNTLQTLFKKLRSTDRVLPVAPNKLITSYIICRNKHWTGEKVKGSKAELTLFCYKPSCFSHVNNHIHGLVTKTRSSPASLLSSNSRGPFLEISDNFSQARSSVPPPPHLPPQVAQALNMSIGEHRHCCVTFKI